MLTWRNGGPGTHRGNKWLAWRSLDLKRSKPEFERNNDGEGRLKRVDCAITAMRSCRYDFPALLLRGAAAAVIGLGSAAVCAESTTEAVHEVRCDLADVVIRTPQPADIPLACDGAGKAIAFLAEQGLDTNSTLTVQLVHELPQTVDDSAVGCFVPSTQRILALVYAEFSKHGTWFGLTVNYDLYRSLVAHEVAHAVAACNFQLEKPSIPAYEYVGYVTMLATMAPALRERVLANFPGTGFDNDLQMNSTVYQFDPMRFGAEAYRHFMKPGNGREYLHRVLAGKALIE